MAAACAHPRPGRPTGDTHRRHCHRHRHRLRTLVADGAGRGADAGDVVHRDCAANPQRKRTDEVGRRAERLFGAALSGHRRDPHAGDLSAAGGGPRRRRSGRTRCRHHLRLQPAAVGADTGGAGRSGGNCAGRALPHAANLACHRADAATGDLHRHGAAARRRHRPAHDPGGPQPSVGDLPGRCGAGQQRIPSRIGKRYRTVQRIAPRPLFHRCGRVD